MKINRIIKRAALLLTVSGMAAFNTKAADYYWGVNGNGAWNGSAASWWPADSGGTPASGPTTNADNVYFSASGITAGAVTVSGNQLANNVYLNQAFNLSGGTIDFSTSASGTLFVNASGTIASVIKTKGIYFQSANQTLTLSGGSPTLTTAAQQISGTSTARATATLILTNGLYQAAGTQFNANIGDFANRSGGLELTASATLSVGVSNQIGSNGEGVLRINGGRWDQTGNDFVIGRNGISGVSNKGYVVLNSGSMTQSSANKRDLLVGFQGGIGVLDVKGGVIDAQGDALAINAANTNTAYAAAYGEVNLSGGIVSVAQVYMNKGIVYAASTTGSAMLNVTGGLLNLGAGGIQNGGGSNTAYAITLSGGTLGTLTAAGWSSDLNMTLKKGANGNVTFSAVTPSFDDSTITLAGKLSGNGGLNVGGGTLLLSGANDYTGQTVIASGAKLELTGTHTIALAALTETAYVLNGDFDLSLGQIILDFNGVTPVTGNSWNLMGGALGNLDFGANTNWLAGFSLDSGDVWKNAADYYFDTGSGILSYGMIPEPSTWALLLGGAGLLAVLRRRK